MNGTKYDIHWYVYSVHVKSNNDSTCIFVLHLRVPNVWETAKPYPFLLGLPRLPFASFRFSNSPKTLLWWLNGRTQLSLVYAYRLVGWGTINLSCLPFWLLISSHSLNSKFCQAAVDSFQSIFAHMCFFCTLCQGIALVTECEHLKSILPHSETTNGNRKTRLLIKLFVRLGDLCPCTPAQAASSRLWQVAWDS